MGADRLAFAVRVTGEVDGVGRLRSSPQLVDHFYFAGNHAIGRLEDIGRGDDNRFRRFLLRNGFASFAFCFRFLLLLIAVLLAGQKDADRFRGEVHHVAVGGLHGITLPQIFFDRLRLGRRFNDYE